MTTRTLVSLAPLAAALALAGCGSAGKSSNYVPAKQEKVVPAIIVPGKEAELFPVKSGNTWVFEDTATQVTGDGQRSGTSEVTFRIVDVADTADGQEATIEISSGGKTTDRVIWRIGPAGIFEGSGGFRDK